MTDHCLTVATLYLNEIAEELPLKGRLAGDKPHSLQSVMRGIGPAVPALRNVMQTPFVFEAVTGRGALACGFFPGFR